MLSFFIALGASIITLLLSLIYFHMVLTRRERVSKGKLDYLNTLIHHMNEVFFTYNTDGYITMVNSKVKDSLGYDPEDIVGKHVLEFVHDIQQDKVRAGMACRLTGGLSDSYETLAVHKDGSLRSVRLNASPIIENGKVTGGMVLAEDITERKRAEAQLEFFSLHDALTGLFNRTFFEQEIRKLDRSGSSLQAVVVCDVDGLKLINDTLGHDKGDLLLITAANLIMEAFGEIGCAARVGGDEFVVLVREADEAAVKHSVQKLRMAVEGYNSPAVIVHLNISVGLSVNDTGNKSPMELFEEADNSMYREKLNHNQSSRSAIVQTLVKTLEARDFLTEGHGERLQELVVALAAKLGFSEQKFNDLGLFAHFHDLGKVGIPDRILQKPGPLTDQELREMRRHAEIGYRIAQSAPDLLPISDWILKHHEWWNGTGYPLGLKQEEIPVEARILAIADAYDAMTHDRPYRKAMDPHTALQEIEKCSGTQFDPILASDFSSLFKGLSQREKTC